MELFCNIFFFWKPIIRVHIVVIGAWLSQSV